jgi:hypothetical protein
LVGTQNYQALVGTYKVDLFQKDFYNKQVTIESECKISAPRKINGSLSYRNIHTHEEHVCEPKSFS